MADLVNTSKPVKQISTVAQLAQQYEQQSIDTSNEAKTPTVTTTNYSNAPLLRSAPPTPTIMHTQGVSLHMEVKNPFLDEYSTEGAVSTSQPKRNPPPIPPSRSPTQFRSRSQSPAKPIRPISLAPESSIYVEQCPPVSANLPSNVKSNNMTSIKPSLHAPPVLPRRPAAYRTTPTEEVLKDTNKPSLPARPNLSQTLSVHKPLIDNNRSPSFQSSPTLSKPSPREFTFESENSDSDEAVTHEDLGESTSHSSLYPDSSNINRRKPKFDRDYEIEHNFKGGVWNIAANRVCFGLHSLKVWNMETSEAFCTLSLGEGVRITSMCFKPHRDPINHGRYVWVGTSGGAIYEVDTMENKKTYKRSGAHSSTVTHILRSGFQMWTFDEGGMLQVWSLEVAGSVSLESMSRNYKIASKQHVSVVVETDLWTADDRQISAYRPTSRNDSFALTPKALDIDLSLGAITCGTYLPTKPNVVFFGHENGKVSVWDREQFTCKQMIEVSLYKIVTLQGVWQYLWIGFKTGNIYVYNVDRNPWIVLKGWRAHRSPVLEIHVDDESLHKVGRIQVASQCETGVILWDGMMTQDWIDKEMIRHQDSYCSFRDLKVLLCSWNIDAAKPADLSSTSDDQTFLEACLNGAHSPDIISFGFQEMIDLESKKMTAKVLFSKKKSEKALAENITHRYKLWHDRLVQAVRIATPPDCPYVLVHSENLVGLFTCIFVKESHKKYLKDVCVTKVKTGLGGFHGNKGAIVIRFIMDNSSICFVNCHLAAGQSHTMQRNNDISTILEQTVLEPVVDETQFFVGGGDGTGILDHEICFLSGDLNYRIDMSRDSVLEKIRNEDFEELLQHDQLWKQRDNNPSFRLRAFHEDSITFPPTYKYNPGTDKYDTSHKQRIPAWCDRILWKGRNIRCLEYRRYVAKVSDHKPISGTFLIRLKSIDGQKWKVKYQEINAECRKMVKNQVESNMIEAQRRLSTTDWYHQSM